MDSTPFSKDRQVVVSVISTVTTTVKCHSTFIVGVYHRMVQWCSNSLNNVDSEEDKLNICNFKLKIYNFFPLQCVD